MLYKDAKAALVCQHKHSLEVQGEIGFDNLVPLSQAWQPQARQKYTLNLARARGGSPAMALLLAWQRVCQSVNAQLEVTAISEELMRFIDISDLHAAFRIQPEAYKKDDLT